MDLKRIWRLAFELTGTHELRYQPIFKAGRIFAFFPFESGLFEDFAQFHPGKTCGNQ